MKIALGADDAYPILKPLYMLLCQAGHVVSCFGALGVESPNVIDTASVSPLSWPQVGLTVGEAVAQGRCEEGIVVCWSGTGVCMAANNRLLSKPCILVSGQEKINEKPECTQEYMRILNLFLTNPGSKRLGFQRSLK